MAEPQTERLHALDAVRGMALIAGIVFHATASFLLRPNGVPVWVISDNHPSLALGVVFHVLHIFRMATFFLIAGFFAHMSFHKRGAVGFIRERAKRIALPLLVGWPLVFAAIVAVVIWAAIAAAHGRPLPPPPKSPGLPSFPLTHLWFLYVLLWLYAVTLVARTILVRLDRGGALLRLADRLTAWLAQSSAGLLVLALPTAVALLATPAWAPWFGVPTPDSSLIPNLAACAAFFSAFAFGWMIHRQAGLLAAWRRRWPLNLALALAFTAIELAISGLAPSIATPGLGWTKLALAVTYPVATWAWTFAVIGLALRFLSGHSPARRYVADASYWLYLIHLPIVLALQELVSGLDWPWPAKLALIQGVALPLMFASYQLLVRHSFIGAILNGPRESRRAANRATPAPSTAEPEAI